MIYYRYSHLPVAKTNLKERNNMKKKKLSILIIVFVVIIAALYMLFIEEISLTEEKENHQPLALVTFQLNDSASLDITCEIASNPEERSEGLMHREELPMDRGMLFVYDETTNVSYWMKNTLIPLDIIFINETGEVINVEEAEIEPDVPDNELTRYNSSAPTKWVVEINQGLSALHGIQPGTHVDIEYLD